MKTNLLQINKYNPCNGGIAKLMNSLGYSCNGVNWRTVYNSLSMYKKRKAIDFKTIFESNGALDTYWALRTQKDKIRLAFCIDIAETVLYIFEEQYPEDQRMRVCINAVRTYCNTGKKIEELIVLRNYAYEILTQAVFKKEHFKNILISAEVVVDIVWNVTWFNITNVLTSSCYASKNHSVIVDQQAKNIEILKRYIGLA